MWRPFCIFLSLYSLSSIVEGYQDGAYTCDIRADLSTISGQMSPSGYPRSQTTGVFTLTANVSQYTGGQPIGLTLSGSLEGFAITPYQGTTANYITTGSWVNLPPKAKMSAAPGTCSQAITHNSPVGLSSMQFTFIPASNSFSWSQSTPALVAGIANFTISVAMAAPGTVYYVFLTQGSAAPSAAQVVAGHDSTGATAPSGNVNLTSSNTVKTAVIVLSPATAYDGYFVGQYTVGNPAITFAAYILDSTQKFFRLVSGSGAPSVAAQSPNVQSTVTKVSGITLSNVPLQSQNITFSPIPAVTYGDGSPDITLSATATSGLPVTFISSNPSVCAVTGDSLHYAGGGTASITARQLGGGNYSAALDVVQACTVNKASQTITVTYPPYDRLLQGASLKMVGYASSVGLPLSYSLNPPTTNAMIQGDIVTGLAPGSVQVVVSSAGNSNYNSASTIFALTIVAPASIPSGATQAYLDIQGLSITNATKDLSQTETYLRGILFQSLGIPKERIELVIVQAIVSNPNDSVEITFNILPGNSSTDPTPDSLFNSIQSASLDPTSNFNTLMGNYGWTVLQVTTVLPYSIQFKGSLIYFATKASGMPDSFEAYWTITGSKILMAVRAKHDGYVGFGFSSGSTAQMVGSDATIGWDGQTYSYINDYHLVDKSTGASLSQGGRQSLLRAEVEYTNEMTTILFQRNLVTNTTIKTSGNTPVVMALGQLPPTGVTGIVEHSDKYSGNLNFQTGEYVATTDPLKTAHAALMWLGWGFFLPLGIITARFLKPFHPPLWFQLHRGFQILGLLLMFCGFIIGAASIGSHTQHTHMGFGYTAISLGILQPFIAIIRPHPPEKGQPASTSRKIWFAVHAGVGYSAVILAFINLLIGMAILDPAPVYQGLLIASIVIWVVIWIVGSIIKFFKKDDDAATPKEITMN